MINEIVNSLFVPIYPHCRRGPAPPVRTRLILAYYCICFSEGAKNTMDFLSALSNDDSQSYILIGFAVLLAFLLSSLIVFTYENSSRDVVPPDHFIQSLILMAIVTTTIMESIGDSMARGFGIFGALAILRFRINITNPRNVAFIFASMAVGIACGVNSFVNAVIGTLAFCLIAFFLRLTPYGRKNNLLGAITIQSYSQLY